MANPALGLQNNFMNKSILLFLLTLLGAPAWADSCPRSFKVATDVEVPVSTYNTSQKDLILWLPSEHGVVSAEYEIAGKLSSLGYEVWVADLFAARFLPISSSSLNTIPVSDVAQLIGSASCGHANVFILSSGQGAARALEGAQLWRQQNPLRPLAGAILLFPNLHAGNPEAGEAPRYLPVTTQVNLPISVLQGALSPWYWQLDELKTQLEQGGSHVAIKKLPGLRDRFYFREDALPRERQAGQQLATAIDDSIRSLLPLNPRKAP